MRDVARIPGLTFAVTVLLAGGSLATAQVGPVPDRIGIYLDQAGTFDCVGESLPYTPVQLYLVAADLSEPSGIAGWEAGIFAIPETLPETIRRGSSACIAKARS